MLPEVALIYSSAVEHLALISNTASPATPSNDDNPTSSQGGCSWSSSHVRPNPHSHLHVVAKQSNRPISISSDSMDWKREFGMSTLPSPIDAMLIQSPSISIFTVSPVSFFSSFSFQIGFEDALPQEGNSADKAQGTPSTSGLFSFGRMVRFLNHIPRPHD